mmetsp:Transcript_1015/g.2375  ORF Transcript_1015/g.2375 Transcript_1015/m.2375 type:complete len:446 (-) Transcript_1015:107-1444(-)
MMKMSSPRVGLALCVCFVAVTYVHATNFAVLLSGGDSQSEKCSDNEDFLMDVFLRGIDQEIRVEVQSIKNKARRMNKAELIDAMAGGANIRERSCIKNWEVNGCDANCTIRVPIRNDGPEDISLDDVTLQCGIAQDIRLDVQEIKNKVKRREGCVGCVSSVYTVHGLGSTDEPVYSWTFGGDGNSAAGTRVRKTMQDLKVASFSGGAAVGEQEIATCPADAYLELRNAPDVIPAYSEVLVEVVASIPENVRLVISANNASAVVDLVRTSVEEILNSQLLCCLKSVRRRVLLGKVLRDALVAYEEGDFALVQDLLRFFARFARIAECDVSDAENICLEKAIDAVMAVARMVAEEAGSGAPELEAYGASADELRRRGDAEAAMMMYRKEGGARTKAPVSQYPKGSYSYMFWVRRQGRSAYSGKEDPPTTTRPEEDQSLFGWLEITRG